MSERMNDPIYKTPRNGMEMIAAVRGGNGRGGPIPIVMYSDVCRSMKDYGPVKTLKTLYNMGDRLLILLQNPDNMKTGHWMTLSFFPKKHEIYFFSSYGGKPDQEKNRWIDHAARIASGQDENPLNDGLKELHERGWTIHYNDFPYQKEGDGSATCGIWAASFLNFNVDPEFFKEIIVTADLNYHDLYETFFK